MAIRRTIKKNQKKWLSLNKELKILDLGCGKAFLLHEIKQILPDIYLIGIDISNHGINNTTPEMKSHLNLYDARKPLPYQEKEFDFLLSLEGLHELKNIITKTRIFFIFL